MLRVSALVLLLSVAAVAAAPARKAFPLAYNQHDFPNDLRLITIPTDYPNVVALYIVVQAGSRNEVEPGKSGFAHLFEHMMFRGTKAFPPAKYEAVLKEAGAASNAYTTDDHTAYHTTFSKEDFEKILAMEADRFKNLDYPPEVFRTETLAVLGEYNKNSSNPQAKLYEVLRNAAFERHTYKHTTMGFLKDIQDMPNQFDYSRLFFERYYRPEYTTIIVAGDITPERTRPLVQKYWGDWERGEYRVLIPQEPAQTEPKSGQIQWPTPTLPWVAVAFHGAAYSDTERDQATLDLISYLGFSESSDLYQKLVIKEQSVDVLSGDNADRIDPYLFTVWSRIKKQEDVDSVRADILRTIGAFKENLVDAKRLDHIKRHLRYSFSLGMNNSEAIAGIVARFVALRRTPETINRVFDIYETITPEDIRSVARRYFKDESRTIVTLLGGKS